MIDYSIAKIVPIWVYNEIDRLLMKKYQFDTISCISFNQSTLVFCFL